MYWLSHSRTMIRFSKTFVIHHKIYTHTHHTQIHANRAQTPRDKHTIAASSMWILALDSPTLLHIITFDESTCGSPFETVVGRHGHAHRWMNKFTGLRVGNRVRVIIRRRRSFDVLWRWKCVRSSVVIVVGVAIEPRDHPRFVRSITQSTHAERVRL